MKYMDKKFVENLFSKLLIGDTLIGAGSHFIVLSHRHLWPFNCLAQLRDDVDEVTLGVVPLVAGLGLPSHVWE